MSTVLELCAQSLRARARLRGARAALEVAREEHESVANGWPGFERPMTNEEKISFNALSVAGSAVNMASADVRNADLALARAIAGDESPSESLKTENEPSGLYPKFAVFRNDGSSRHGHKHFECDYFVLDWNHDKYARVAALAYADACEAEFPELAADLRARAERA